MGLILLRAARKWLERVSEISFVTRARLQPGRNVQENTGL
jgi:hypothetical protein